MSGRHVLIARCDSAGDVLLAGPAVRAVAAGAATVSLLVGPRGLEAAQLLPGVDRVICFHTPWIDAEPLATDRGATLALVDRLQALGLDQALVLTSFHQSPLPLALLLRLAGVPTIAAISDDYPGSLLDIRHRVPEDVHEVERALSLVAALDYRLSPSDTSELRVRTPAGLSGAVSDLAPYLVVHPGASVRARAWGAERHTQLVAELAASDRRVVVTGGPDERGLTASVAGRSQPGVLDLGGRLSLAEMARVLASADAIVAGNTGPAHLAAAVGTPVVSLYAPTVPAVRWRPWRVRHELLFEPVPCAGCRAHNCRVSGHPCLAGIGVADVLAALGRLAPAMAEAA
ncbi:MAG TPA: glycosyltransferase family 9 protein [Solirubrobacteraceae bacterium]|nr:glycosyltransferase family 9 protein [Solirubrobacteraceae bacterium]